MASITVHGMTNSSNNKYFTLPGNQIEFFHKYWSKWLNSKFLGLFFCTWVWMPDHVPSAIAIVTDDRLQLHSSLIRRGCISPLKHSKRKYMKWHIHCQGHIHLHVDIYWIYMLHNTDMELFTYKPVKSSIAITVYRVFLMNEWKPNVNMVLSPICWNLYINSTITR